MILSTSKKPAINFGTAFDAGMNYLATNKTIGATAVDMASMVIPRTVIDTTRSPQAGVETFRREFSSCLLYLFVGGIGKLSGYTLSLLPKNKKYRAILPTIQAGQDSVEVFANIWKKNLKNKNQINAYYTEIFKNTKGVSGNQKISINKNTCKDLASHMTSLMNCKHLDKKQKNILIQKITNATGANESLILSLGGKQITLKADELIDHSFHLANSFSSPKINKEFLKTKEIKDTPFIKSLKNFSKQKMLLGLGIVSAIAISMQAVNRYLTKKKTGSDHFVGVESQNTIPKSPQEKKKEKAKFSTQKLLTTGAMLAFTTATIGKFKDIPKKLEFTGSQPNLAQYKYIYGITIAGRLLASRDKNELRETATRDVMGFSSWLILGDIAAKSIASIFEKKKGISLLNNPNPNKTGIVKLLKSNLKNHSELVYANKNTVGKSLSKAIEICPQKTKESLKYLNLSQLGGYLFSGILLGVVIPVINKKITEKLSKKKEK